MVVDAQPPFGYAGQPASPSKGALILGKYAKHWLSILPFMCEYIAPCEQTDVSLLVLL